MGTRIEKLTPAIAIHPGEMILDEIKANELTQADFAKKIGMERSQLNEIIKGKRVVNAELAIILEASLGLPAQYWLNLQNQYDLDKVKVEKRAEERVLAITLMTEISEYVSVKYLRKQKVLTGDPVCDIPVIYDIYGVSNNVQLIECYNNPQYARFRKSEKLNIDKTNLIGWVKYSEYIAKSVKTKQFKYDSWKSLKSELRTLICKNKHVHERSQSILSKYGIKLLYQDKAEKAPIDGIAFWSNENPTIAMTLRHKRLDNFAFTLFHELGHVFLHLLGDNTLEIIDLAGNDEEFKATKEEKEANDFASNNLIPEDSWIEFKSREDLYEDDLIDFAHQIGIHPSVVLGRLCFEYNNYKVKTNIVNTIG
mgnify:CR=1 FL=1